MNDGSRGESAVRAAADAAGAMLEHDAFGRLVWIDARGARHAGVLPVRAFPLTAPGEGIAVVGADGRELAWIERLDALPPALHEALQAALADREFMPTIRRIRSVSTFSTPSRWEVETDRGDAAFVLSGEENIRRLGEDGALLISDSHGVGWRVADRFALDRASRRLLERFL